MTGRGKTSHLLADPPTPVTDAWTLEDIQPTTSSIDHNGARDLGLGLSSRDCEEVMVFSARTLRKK